jgi:hypothetical protein
MSLARQVVTRLVDDLDGSDGAATVSFSLDGCDFEIDLSAEHLAEFRARVAPFVAAARRVAGGPQRPVGRSAAGGAEPVVPSAEPGVRPAVGRAASGGSRVVSEAATIVVATMSAESSTSVSEAAADAMSAPSPERKRMPLVVDPFSQEMRLV